jgi:hypothetical protein
VARRCCAERFLFEQSAKAKRGSGASGAGRRIDQDGHGAADGSPGLVRAVEVDARDRADQAPR